MIFARQFVHRSAEHGGLTAQALFRALRVTTSAATATARHDRTRAVVTAVLFSGASYRPSGYHAAAAHMTAFAICDHAYLLDPMIWLKARHGHGSGQKCFKNALAVRRRIVFGAYC
jgi:hypothetical protein